MSNIISQKTFQFLSLLKDNNKREWFNENKDLYVEAQDNILQFLEELIDELSTFDEDILKISPKKALFRIYRDVRFSLDKSPYKKHFGAGLGFGKGDRISGYYLHVEPGNSFIAGGVYSPDKEILKKLRLNISGNSDEFIAIINGKQFQKYFADLSQEDKLKRIPQGFDKDDAIAEYLKLKSFVVRYPLNDIVLMKNDSIKNLSEICKAIKPLNDFIEKVK